MNLLNKAIRIASEKHDGQTDKGGQPYILHPLRVMLAAETQNERIVAVLHDLLEDTDTTTDELLREGFSQEIITAIECLTRKSDESYENFINRVKQNPLAAKVKLLDIADNMNLSRISNPSSEDYARLQKYQNALEILRS